LSYSREDVGWAIAIPMLQYQKLVVMENDSDISSWPQNLSSGKTNPPPSNSQQHGYLVTQHHEVGL
jgi:hypothetical protein